MFSNRIDFDSKIDFNMKLELNLEFLSLNIIVNLKFIIQLTFCYGEIQDKGMVHGLHLVPFSTPKIATPSLVIWSCYYAGTTHFTILASGEISFILSSIGVLCPFICTLPSDSFSYH